MVFETCGKKDDPAVLFFHAMGVTGGSSEPVARVLRDRYFCVLPTATLYCAGAEVCEPRRTRRGRQRNSCAGRAIKRLALVVASSIGADLALAFLAQTTLPVEHVFFDGGQFAQIGRATRRVMTPFLVSGHQEPVLVEGRDAQENLLVRRRGDSAVLYCSGAGR